MSIGTFWGLKYYEIKVKPDDTDMVHSKITKTCRDDSTWQSYGT